MTDIQTTQKAHVAENHKVVKELRVTVDALTSKCEQSTEEIIDLQCRSMRDNLMFYNIPEEHDENCSEIIGTFMERNLKIHGAKDGVKIERAHRIGKRRRGGQRPIVAKFHSFQDRKKVRSASKQLEGTDYGIGQQFPKAVQEGRHILIDVMKRERARGKTCTLTVDRLYVNNELYAGPEEQLKDMGFENEEEMLDGEVCDDSGHEEGVGYSNELTSYEGTVTDNGLSNFGIYILDDQVGYRDAVRSDEYKANLNPDHKCSRSAKLPGVQSVLTELFNNSRSRDIPLSDTMLDIHVTSHRTIQ
ncbi:hypothetical protein FSP39_002459 [Pinctada imbricata]|uniref:Uncharacterized protein n=1 Tax=Pinctada imbricata TaxID=66713 RepID=A0AA88YCI5_PINIB|nr:hypothetical protein FSP39_002459 [Pinctada imbricata]